jgi:hypothetical protein
VQLPRVATFKDTAITVAKEHLSRVSTDEVQNESAEPSSHQRSDREDIEAAMMKRASLDRNVWPWSSSSKKEDDASLSDGGGKDVRKDQQGPTFSGEYFDTFLSKKTPGEHAVSGRTDQVLSDNPKDVFERLFEDDVEPHDEEESGESAWPEKSAGSLAVHNTFIEDVCHHNERIPKTMVRLKILIFDAWWKFTNGGRMFSQEDNQKDIVRFKEVMYYYRSDIKKDATALKSDKEAAKKAQFVERTFDLHLQRCWLVAREMNPVARDKEYELNPQMKVHPDERKWDEKAYKGSKKAWKVIPWLRMHEFAYIFILAFGYAGYPEDKDYWQNADWLGLMNWEFVEDEHAHTTRKYDNTPNMENRYEPKEKEYKDSKGNVKQERLYNFDLLDKWRQQLSSDRSAVSGQYVKFIHVTYYKGDGISDPDEKWHYDVVFGNCVNDPSSKRCVVKRVEPGGNSERAGVKEGMVLVKINGKSFSARLWRKAAVDPYDPSDPDSAVEYTLSFIENTRAAKDLYDMEKVNPFSMPSQEDRTSQYVEFPFFVEGDKHAHTVTKHREFIYRKHFEFGKQFPAAGFDDPAGLIDFREASNEAWWWEVDEKAFSRDKSKEIRKKMEDPAKSRAYYGPFEPITKDMFLNFFMAQRLDMFTNLADANLLNHATKTAKVTTMHTSHFGLTQQEYDEIDFTARDATSKGLEAYVLKELRGKTKLHLDAFRFVTDRLDKEDTRYRLMEHIRAQYSWRAERDSNYERVAIRNDEQIKELIDYRNFLKAVWKAGQTMVPFARKGRWPFYSGDNYRGKFISDPAFHYAAIVAQEFCWKHVREVKGKYYQEAYTQNFGRDTLMLIPLEVPESLMSDFEKKGHFKANRQFESFSGQKVEEVEHYMTGEKSWERQTPFNPNMTTVYRVPGQLLQDVPDPWVDEKSTFKYDHEEQGVGSTGEITNWNHVTMMYLDNLFGDRSAWAAFPISNMTKQKDEKVSKVMTTYLDHLDDKEIARLREEEERRNGSAFNVDRDEEENALRPG